MSWSRVFTEPIAVSVRWSMRAGTPKPDGLDAGIAKPGDRVDESVQELLLRR